MGRILREECSQCSLEAKGGNWNSLANPLLAVGSPVAHNAMDLWLKTSISNFHPEIAEYNDWLIRHWRGCLIQNIMIDWSIDWSRIYLDLLKMMLYFFIDWSTIGGHSDMPITSYYAWPQADPHTTFTGHSDAAVLARLVCNHVNQVCAWYMPAIMRYLFWKSSC